MILSTAFQISLLLASFASAAPAPSVKARQDEVVKEPQEDVLDISLPIWYKTSPAAEAAAVEKRQEEVGDDKGLEEDVLDISLPIWYKTSPAAEAAAVEKRQEDDVVKEPQEDVLDISLPIWYKTSPAAEAAAVEKRQEDEVVEGPQEDVLDISLPIWYKTSPAAEAAAVQKRQEEEGGEGLQEDVLDISLPIWYKTSPAAEAEAIEKRDAHAEAAEAKMAQLRRYVFEDMRKKDLRSVSEKGKAFFQFTPKPHNDTVDRWHVPAQLTERYASATDDADRVSTLNYYLYVTDRQPKSAEELGFEPTLMMPMLVDNGNEVGFGYAFEGQHQYHCADFLADAIEIGKQNINDFYLQHTIHCLSLIKFYATRLTKREPLTLFTSEAENLIKAGYKQTINKL